MPEMKFVGGHPCLDFVNTVGARVSRVKKGRDYADVVLRDKLTDYQALASWSSLAGLSTAKELRAARLRPEAAARILKRAVRLREALYRILKSFLEGWRPPQADVDILTRELLAARSHERLLISRTGLVWAWNDSEELLEIPLWRLAQSAEDLFRSADLKRLRQCGGDECGWLFLASRNRSRRWCDMKECGNRAKVRRFRERHT